MKVPKIKINVDSGEAEIINWEEFEQMNSLWQLDILKDLLGAIKEKYNEAYFFYLNDMKEFRKEIKKIKRLEKKCMN